MEIPTSDTTFAGTQETVNVTEIFENRHIAYSCQRIDAGLKDYLPDYSRDRTSEVYVDGYFWILLGDFTISTEVKEAILNRYIVKGNRPIVFERWETLKNKFPNGTVCPKVQGIKPVFIGFPLPEEEL